MTKMPMPPITRTRGDGEGFRGALPSGRIAPGISGSSIASPQWIQNFHVGATGDPHPTQVSISIDCIGVAFEP